MLNKLSQTKRHYKFLMFYTAAFIACFIIQGVLLNRLISLGGSYYVTGGTFIYFATPLITDVVAEIYGYQVARQLLWLGLFSIVFLAISTTIILSLPCPDFWKPNAAAYHTALHSLPRATVAGIIAVVSGQFINIYLISKWKIIVGGKYFWLRSASSSIIGDAITVTTSLLLIFGGKVPTNTFASLIIPELVIMLAFSTLGAIPALLLVKITTKAEEIESADNAAVNFNPFKLFIDNN